MRRTSPPYDWGRRQPRPAHRDPMFWLFLVGWAFTVAVVVHVGLAR